MMTRKEYAVNRLKDPIFLACIGLFITFSFASLIYFAVISMVRNVIISLLCVLLALPVFLGGELLLKVKLPNAFLCVLVVFCASGILLGPCYDLYTILPWWDDMLHTASGAIFTCLGYAIARPHVKDSMTKKGKFNCLIFGFMFTLAIALLWEIYEYIGSALGFDMQEDSIVTSFDSYLLSGTHSETFVVDGIEKTIIHYGNGKELIIDGYIDIGLFDTLNDMLVCFIGAIVLCIPLGICIAKNISVDRFIIPSQIVLVKRKDVVENDGNEVDFDSEEIIVVSDSAQ